MKKIYSVIIALFPLLTFAQPTVTQSDLPVVGTKWVLGMDPAYTDAIQPGGANATWNYSALLSSFIDSLVFEASSGTPYASTFPGSNIASPNALSGVWSYFTTDFSGMYYNGSTSTGISTDSMNPPLLYIPVPFTFNGSTSSMSQVVRDSTDGTSCYTLYHIVNSTFTADGYGTLTIPSGTFPNVLRIAINEIVTDSSTTDFFCLGLFTLPGTGTTTQVMRYRYLLPGSATSYLLGINADASGTTAFYSEYVLNPISVSVNELERSRVLNVFPNPANESIHFTLAGNGKENAEIKVYDAMNRIVYSRNTGGELAFDIPVENLESGVYYYALQTDSNVQSGKFTVVH